MNLLLVTDSFPPKCGGSGWSTYELARGMRNRGHQVLVVKVAAAKRGTERETTYDEFRVIEYKVFVPPVPGLRNYLKNERTYRILGKRLERLIADERIAIVHGQHVMSCVPAVEAAQRTGIPSVCTVRDYWPVCYRSDLIHSPRGLALCPGCSRAAGVHRGPPRIGVTGLATSMMRAYLQANLHRKQNALLDAHGVIAVSSRIAADLKARAPVLERARIEIIPNPVDTTAVRDRAAAASPMTGPYALYVGKLARNKGTSYLADVVKRADLDWPLVIVGDGPDRVAFEQQAARSGKDIRLVGWLDPAETATWLSHASLLLFPSSGPESLSRVLIEASALGIPIAAMNTGGTPDIIEDEVTGLLSESPEELAADVRRLRSDAQLRTRLGTAAAQRAREKFEASSVCARIDALYGDLLNERERSGAGGGPRVTERASRGAASAKAPPPRAGGPGDKSMLRVVIVARSVFPLHGMGGLERSVYDLARHLAMRDVQVTVITRTPLRSSEPDAIHPRVEVQFVPYRTFPGAGRRGTTVIDRSTAYPLFGLRAGAVAAAMVERGEADIVHGFGASVLGYARRRHSLPAPLVLNPQGLEEFGATDPSRAPLKRLGYLPLRRAVIACARRADAVIATDRALEPAVRAHLGVPDQKIYTIPNALDLVEVDALAGPADGARLKTGTTTLLSVGRLEENKGFHILAAALAALKEHSGRIAREPWRWVIVGAGPFRARLERILSETGLTPNVLLAGRVDDRELHAWYEAADLFVHPTLYEGSSLVTLEAMAHRRPCVVTNAGGLPDKVKNGINGWVVPAGDASALAAAISGALEDSQRLARMGDAGRQIVEREFSWTTAVDKTLSLYSELLVRGAAVR